MEKRNAPNIDFMPHRAMQISPELREFINLSKERLWNEAFTYRESHPNLVDDHRLFGELLRHLKTQTVIFLAAYTSAK